MSTWVALVLRTYSRHRAQILGEIIEARLQHPNLEILQLLYDQNSRIVSFEWNNHIDIFVTKASPQPPEKITGLLLCLIEHDADLEAGYIPEHHAMQCLAA